MGYRPTLRYAFNEITELSYQISVSHIAQDQTQSRQSAEVSEQYDFHDKCFRMM